MPSPLIGIGDLDRTELGLQNQVLGLGSTLQSHFGGGFGLGKWVRHGMGTINMRASAAGSSVTAKVGEVAYTIVGDTMICSLMIVSFTVSGAATNEVWVQLPDNWQYAPRGPQVSADRRVIGPIALYNGTSGTALGIVVVDVVNPTYVKVNCFASPSFPTTANSGAYGQISFECQQIGERA